MKNMWMDLVTSETTGIAGPAIGRTSPSPGSSEVRPSSPLPRVFGERAQRTPPSNSRPSSESNVWSVSLTPEVLPTMPR